MQTERVTYLTTAEQKAALEAFAKARGESVGNVVREATAKAGEVVLVVDATNALGGFRGRLVRLVFSGVRRRFSEYTCSR